MSVGDEYEEGKLALQRASMTLTDWIAEVKDEVTSEWLAGNVADPVALLETAATEYLSCSLRFYSIINDFESSVVIEAKRRMEKARDDYEEQYGRRI